MERPRLTQEDYEALADLRYALRRFIDFSAGAALSHGLPAQQHQALLAIKGYHLKEPITVGALAERLLIAPHTATELVNRLTQAELVERRSGARDRRQQTVHLTQRAEDLLARLSEVHLAELHDLAPQLIVLLKRFTKASADSA